MDDNGTSLVEYKDYQVTKNLELEAILNPGLYIVVPKTTGCLFPKLSMKKPYPFADELLARDRRGVYYMTAQFECVVEDIFRQYDSLERGILDFEAFKSFLLAA